MYTWLPGLCRDLRSELIEVYWILIVPVVLFQVVLEYFKLPEHNPDIPAVIKRAIISIILLISFEEVLLIISMVGEGLANRIGGLSDVKRVLDEMGNFLDGIELSWTKLKQTLIFALSLISYIAAYLGVFVADALIHFCWAVLYVISPLLILAYIPPGTAGTCRYLYRSLCMVMCWKVLWAILGALLLKLSTSVPIQDGQNYNSILLIVINLFIGASMLFVPFATKSLINDGLSLFASGLAALPAMAAQKTLLKYVKHIGNKGLVKSTNLTSAGKLMVTNRASRAAAWVKRQGKFKGRNIPKKDSTRGAENPAQNARGPSSEGAPLPPSQQPNRRKIERKNTKASKSMDKDK